MKGDSLVEAMGAANTWLDNHTNLYNQAQATMMVGPEIDINKNLKDNGL
jgi:hypothetical protein